MGIANALAFAAALLVARALMLGLPFFSETVRQAPLLNASCGAASDLALALLWAALCIGLARFATKRAVNVAFTVLTSALILVVAAHLRYVEDFGMMVRPFHLATVGSPEVAGVGSMMVLESWRSSAVLIVGFGVMALSAWRLVPGWSRWWSATTPKQAGKWLGALLALAAALHSTMLNFQNKKGMHPELRQNLFTALDTSYRNFAKWRAMPLPGPEILAKARGVLHGPRAFAAEATGYPVWQSRISASEDGSADVALRDDLRSFIAAESKAKGPWNVVLVMSESLRAFEINSMGSAPPEFQSATPNLDRIAKDGVRFTSMLNIGYRTHLGQMATFCSIYAVDDFSILTGAVSDSATCLGDIFRAHGYDTGFFYGADNNFDNQEVFYRAHGMTHIVDERDFPKDTPMGVWGKSDHALFGLTVDRLKASSQPFFAVVLTLSNHQPPQLPQDTPPNLLLPTGSPLLQVIQYVDWSTGEFYDRLRKELPHTIFVMVADHGRFINDLLTNELPAEELLWRTARIPFFLVVPDAPERLRNQEVKRLASNVDVGPTLLSLLGWLDETQQFMGQDAFSRQGSVYMDFQKTFIEVNHSDTVKLNVKYVDQATQDAVAAISRFNLLVPPTATKALR